MKSTEICKEIIKRFEEKHMSLISGYEKPLLLISAEYPGLWLEHVYDSVFYATLDKDKLYLAESATEIFMRYQKPDGQLPYVAKNNDSPDALHSPGSHPVFLGARAHFGGGLAHFPPKDRSLLPPHLAPLGGGHLGADRYHTGHPGHQKLCKREKSRWAL